MKVTEVALRRIIREAVQRKLDEAPSMDDVSGFADLLEWHVTRAVIEVDLDEVVEDADPNMVIPVRYEDVDALVEAVVKTLLKEGGMINTQLHRMARQLITKMMEPV